MSLRNSQGYIFHLIFLFSLPILFKDLSVWNTCLIHQIIFDCHLVGGIGSLVFVAGAEVAESFVFQLEGFVAVGIGCSAVEGCGWSGAEGVGAHPWLILLITILVLFSVLFFTFANGAM